MQDIITEIKALLEYAKTIKKESWQWKAVKVRIAYLERLYKECFEIPK